MIMVGAMCATLWGVGVAMGAPRQARWNMIGLLIIAVMVLQVVLPDGHPLREATGGDARLWGLVLAFAAVVVGYSAFLRKLKQRSEPVQVAAARTNSFSATELDRYARHIVLREVGGPGQRAIRDAKVLVVGAGGLGAPALQYLAAAGVGTIGVIDDDVVELSNLQRQVIHSEKTLGLHKVESAAARMRDLNSVITVETVARRFDDTCGDLISDVDLVINGADNFSARYTLNDLCLEFGKPLIDGAVLEMEGQVSVFCHPDGGPCYRCLYPETPPADLAPSCAAAGVLGVVPGTIGMLQALEAAKLLAGFGKPLVGRLLSFDATESSFEEIAFSKDPTCMCNRTCVALERGAA